MSKLPKIEITASLHIEGYEEKFMVHELVRALRESLPVVFDRGQISKQLRKEKVNCLNFKPEGWDDFFVHIKYDIQIHDTTAD